MMLNVFALEDARDGVDSIFLAGPTPAPGSLEKSTSWRHDAVRLLVDEYFDGDILIPEPRNGKNTDEWTYSKQVDWEVKMLAKATVILFWVPRELASLPGFTTNIEFGEWMKSGKIVIGSPDSAVKVRYLQERCNRLKIEWANTLRCCVTNALAALEEMRGKSSKVWFTADTHFGHQRTLELSRRPFKTVDEMSWKMVERWNSTVGDDDTVYHLGDFGDPKFINHLRGAKILILPGNYDDNATLEALKQDRRVSIIVENCLLDGASLVRMIHEPNHAQTFGADFFLFGHIHRLQMVKRNGLNVGVDCHDFRPIDMETVMFYKNAICKHYDSNVFVDALG